MPYLVQTCRYTRGKLPHWEVQDGRYFVTLRCADSLPREAAQRLSMVARELAGIQPASPAFAGLQRIYFRTAEKYLDAGYGRQPLREAKAAEVVICEFESARIHGFEVVHYVIMPNHVHLLVRSLPGHGVDLKHWMRLLKGRSARGINQRLGSSGSLWQREWFDRWIRNDAEWDRCVTYIRNNPVCAGLVGDWTQYPYVR